MRLGRLSAVGPPAPRLRLGHWLPAILTGVINLAIPALLISAQRTADKREQAEIRIAAGAAEIGPDCAKNLREDLCICSDFATQAQAQAYVAALEALGRPPVRRFGLYTDESDRPCAHLPNE